MSDTAKNLYNFIKQLKPNEINLLRSPIDRTTQIQLTALGLIKQRLNRNSETPVRPDDDGEIITKLEYVKLLDKNIAGCTLTKLGEAAILGDLHSFVKFYQRLVLQDFSLSQDNQNSKNKKNR